MKYLCALPTILLLAIIDVAILLLCIVFIGLILIEEAEISFPTSVKFAEKVWFS